MFAWYTTASYTTACGKANKIIACGTRHRHGVEIIAIAGLGSRYGQSEPGIRISAGFLHRTNSIFELVTALTGFWGVLIDYLSGMLPGGAGGLPGWAVQTRAAGRHVGCRPACVILCHLLYFALGWCTTMATVERSGVIWPDGVSLIPILSGLSMSHTRRC